MNNIKPLKFQGRSILLRPAEDDEAHKGTLVLLHGYGADEYDLMGLAPYFDANLDILSIRAPGSTPYGGASWFDIGLLEDGALQFNAEQALTSCSDVIDLIAKMQNAGILRREKIILGGFSQGSSISALAALSAPEIVRALLIMSGRLTEGVRVLLKHPEHLAGVPVFVGHGTLDQVIPISFGREIVDFWQTLPVKLEHHEYGMGHEINQTELIDIQNWFDREIF